MTITGLNQLIKRSGLKKKYIASKCGLSSMELSHIINGRRDAKPEVLGRLQSFLQTIIKQQQNEENTLLHSR